MKPTLVMIKSLFVMSCGLATGVAVAADWSDTSIGWRSGSDFREPYIAAKIKKNIFNLQHVSGYKYGSQFFNVDLLQSSSKDPATTDFTNGDRGAAQEAYIVYRHTLDLGKVTGKDFRFKGVRGVGLTAGFDWNTKNDATYNSKKRMLVLGPTLMVDVPGFLDVSLFTLKESNAPSGFSFASGGNYSVSRYTYKQHLMLNLAWGIETGVPNLKFEGYGLYIAAKGKDEFGGTTKPETHIDAALMYDLGPLVGTKGLRAGVGYEYWQNKFGNDHTGPAGPGAFAKTSMVKVDYHF